MCAHGRYEGPEDVSGDRRSARLHKLQVTQHNGLYICCPVRDRSVHDQQVLAVCERKSQR